MLEAMKRPNQRSSSGFTTSRFIRCGALILLSMLPAHTHSSFAQKTAEPQRQTSTPYTGDLSIFEYKDRDRKLQIGRVMDLLGIVPGKTVADLGAGSGWFTVRAATRVGDKGLVFAEDINPAAVKAVRERAEKERLVNIHAVQGTPDDPMLPPGSVDAALMLKVYHEVAHPEVLLGHLKTAMKPGAKFGIIDRNGNGTDHGLNEAVVDKELAQAGFHRVGRYDFTKADGQDYFLIFEKN